MLGWGGGGGGGGREEVAIEIISKYRRFIMYQMMDKCKCWHTPFLCLVVQASPFAKKKGDGQPK